MTTGVGLSSAPVLITFLGGMGGSAAEAMVAAARRAAALDLVERALATGAFAGAVIATDQPDALGPIPRGAVVDEDVGPFHFGRRLQEVISRFAIQRPLYVSGGALPLLTSDSLVGLARHLEQAKGVIVTNNYYSADLVGFVPGSAVHAVPPPTTDNPLARLLAEATGLPTAPLPRSPATQLDIDTPADLHVLSLLEDPGPRLGQLLRSLCLDVQRYRRCLPLFTDPRAQVLVTGRVGSHTWQYLERETACRVRMLAEERGMQADGRYHAGTVRSILGFYLEQVGLPRFFDTLAQLGDAAFLDSRVLLAHLGHNPSRADRFASDLGHVEAIADPFLRSFTEAAGQAPIPILLGGHSLVSGGLMALVDLAWREHDRARAGGGPTVDSSRPLGLD